MSRDTRPDDVLCPFCGHELAWDEWQRHWHNPDRSDDSGRPSPILSAAIRLVWSVSLRLVVVAAALIVLLTIVLGYYHWNKGTSVESALELTA